MGNPGDQLSLFMFTQKLVAFRLKIQLIKSVAVKQQTLALNAYQ
jgi:hypothetical protein